MGVNSGCDGVVGNTGCLNTVVGYLTGATGSCSIVLGACARSTGSGQFVIGSTTYPVGPIQTGTFSFGSSGVITGVTFLIAKINGQDYKIAISI